MSNAAAVSATIPQHSSQTVAVASVDDQCATQWNDYVARRAAASIYHRYEWRRLIAAVFRHDTHYFIARDGAGAICGLVPLVRLRSLLFGDFLVSMPYFNYGGIVSDDESAACALREHVAEFARSLGVSHVELRHSEPVCPDWPARTDKVSMRLDLPPSAGALDRQLGSKVRAQIKRPVREGATCVHGHAELLADFYAVFARNMRDLGTPVYSRALFASVLQALGDQARVFIVRWRGAPVAAALVIGDRGRLEIPWASSLREANAIGVNMLLYWNVLEYACERQYASFDFGRSTVDAGTYRFKKQWGAQPTQLHWHYWLRAGGEPPVLNPSNPKYRLAIAAWQRLPLAVANRIGPLLVRNLP
ncbi:MAG TPA: FemAB family XrtA/PEP-CTERM system-associated protein [Steroidobacteraceae bacterium]|nr:FemAB family XrtA/PEP-CTERM system-associated protein [Steroidobacteraceae bacterium]